MAIKICIFLNLLICYNTEQIYSRILIFAFSERLRNYQKLIARENFQFYSIVDFHAALQNSKSIPGTIKAHKVQAVATLLQLFNKVGSDEGQKMVQQRHLHVLLPRCPLPAKLTTYAGQGQWWPQERL